MVLLLLAVVTLLFGGALDTPAYAACNMIPVSPVFRGALGSMDRPFVSPDTDERVTLRLAPRLDSDSAEAPSAEGMSLAEGIVVMILFKSAPRQVAKALYIASEEKCEELEESGCFLKRLFCRARRTCIPGSAVGESVSTKSGIPELSFRFPDTDEAGPVTIAVSTTDQPPPSELRQQSCQDLVHAKRKGLRLCIDKFFPLPEDDPPGDPTFPGLVALPSSYDYRTICTYSVGDPKCTGPSYDNVLYTINSEGDVLMPVRWSNILLSNGSQFYQRDLLASTAVEAVQGQGMRIFVPSEVFLETTTQQGGGFTPNPTFMPLELPMSRPNEQVFNGTADQGKSVLKFARRKLWGRACNGGPNQSQACQPEWAGADCPSAQCVQSAPTYFACASGSRSRLPCTRPAHCPGGTCQAVSKSNPNVCVLFDGTQSVTACTNDSDCGPRCLPGAGPSRVCVAFDGTKTGTPCKKDNDCPPTAECGPGLFEFRNRTVKGIGRLERVDPSVRSVCDNSEGNLCAGSAGATACTGSADCVTYRAAAQQYTAPIPTP